MTKLCDGLETAIRFFNDVEGCVRSAGGKFETIELYPWQSVGGRSNGITACFERGFDCLYITFYCHWNSDQLDLQFSLIKPAAMADKHDEPHLQLKYNEIDLANLTVQFVLNGFYKLILDVNDMTVARPFGYHIADGKLTKVACRHADKILEQFTDQCEICKKFVRKGTECAHEK